LIGYISVASSAIGGDQQTRGLGIERLTTPTQTYRQPSTLRTTVFLAGASLGRLGKKMALKLSAAWGGLQKHKPLIEAVLDWPHQTSPKLIHPVDRLTVGGGFI
jgi:hypothetical protein